MTEYPKRQRNGDIGEHLFAYRVMKVIGWPCRLLDISTWTMEHCNIDEAPNFGEKSRSAGFSSKTAETATLAARDALSEMVKQTEARYLNWIKATDCQILPLEIEDCRAAWEAYFKGGPPFNSKKNKEHLPDAHILFSLSKIKGGKCFFVSSDRNLQEHAALLEGVTATHNFFPVFAALGQEDEYKSFINTFPRFDPNTATQDKMREALLRDLPGSQIRGDIGGEKIGKVEVHEFVIRDQGAIPIDPNSAIVGFQADLSIVIRSEERKSLTVKMEDRAASARIEGHMVVDITSQSSELDDFEIQIVEIESTTVVSERKIDPAVKVGWLHRDTLQKTLSSIKGGVIFTIGGNDIERKKIAETLALKRIALIGKELVAVRLFSLNEPAADVHPISEQIGLSDLIEKHHPDVICLAVQDPSQLHDLFWIASNYPEVLFITAMKGPRSGEQLVREIDKSSEDSLSYLEAYAQITGHEEDQTIFNFNTGCGWGSGDWAVVLERDEMLGRKGR